jgi:hypothetical protein
MDFNDVRLKGVLESRSTEGRGGVDRGGLTYACADERMVTADDEGHQQLSLVLGFARGLQMLAEGVEMGQRRAGGRRPRAMGETERDGSRSRWGWLWRG